MQLQRNNVANLSRVTSPHARAITLSAIGGRPDAYSSNNNSSSSAFNVAGRGVDSPDIFSRPQSHTRQSSSNAGADADGVGDGHWTHKFADGFQWIVQDSSLASLNPGSEPAQRRFQELCEKRDTSLRSFLRTEPSSNLLQNDSQKREFTLLNFLIHSTANSNLNMDANEDERKGEDADSDADAQLVHPEPHQVPTYPLPQPRIARSGKLVPFRNSKTGYHASIQALRDREFDQPINYPMVPLYNCTLEYEGGFKFHGPSLSQTDRQHSDII